MIDIYGLVEVNSEDGLILYFVTIDLTEHELILSDRSQGKKSLNLKIPLSEIKQFNTQTTYGIEQVSFWYNEVNYKFVEYGNQTIRFLRNILKKRLSVHA